MTLQLRLESDGSPSAGTQFIRIPSNAIGHTLELVLWPGSKALYRGQLHTNVPKQGKTSFDRKTLYCIPIVKQSTGEGKVQIVLPFPGIFEYFFTYESLNGEPCTSSIRGSILVESVLILPKSKSTLSLSMISWKTFVPKWMGHLDEWSPILKNASAANYNMIHILPLQKRGPSNSPYSLASVFEFSDDIFPENEPHSLETVKKFIDSFRNSHDLLFTGDIVFNHWSSANPSLLEHPEIGYNVYQCLHLLPALTLDISISEFSKRRACSLRTREDLENVMRLLKEDVCNTARLWEYYVFNVQDIIANFQAQYDNESSKHASLPSRADRLQAIKQTLKKTSTTPFGRFPFLCDIPALIAIFQPMDLLHALNELHEALNELNMPFYDAYNKDIDAAFDAIHQTAMYERFSGRHRYFMQDLSEAMPLTPNYFTILKSKTEIRDYCFASNSSPTPVNPRVLCYALANNGWIMDADPLIDFASSTHHCSYFRREIVIWSDCVKLRYGDSEADNPWLWQTVKDYTMKMAKLFDGLRIDNCHSTPLHVASYMLDAARSVSPNIYIVAELFTGSSERDMTFVGQLGCHSLIREAMVATTPMALSHIIYQYGGVAFGSAQMKHRKQLSSNINTDRGYETTPHTLLMDCTHDNQMPTELRTVQDTPSTAALVCMSSCAIGSVMGYDELFPKHLDIVRDQKRYELPTFVQENTSILTTTIEPSHRSMVQVKKFFLGLHREIVSEGYQEIYVHCQGEVIQVHKQHPDRHVGYLLLTRSAFKESHRCVNSTVHCQHCAWTVHLPGLHVEFVYYASMSDVVDVASEEGCFSRQLASMDIHREKCPPWIHMEGENIKMDRFPAGSVLLLRTRYHQTLQDKLAVAEKMLLWRPDVNPSSIHDCFMANVLLFRCNAEECDSLGIENAVYHVPDYGNFSYCGILSLYRTMQSAKTRLDHPICRHLQQGNWIMHYHADRLAHYIQRYPDIYKHRLQPIQEWLKNFATLTDDLPGYLRVNLVSQMTETVISWFSRHPQPSGEVVASINRPMNNDHLSVSLEKERDPFTDRLVLSLYQFYGHVPSARLMSCESTNDFLCSPSGCLSAGLPHFTKGYFRCWGRDTFISLPGLKYMSSAVIRDHLLAFARCVFRGLLPNLMDSGCCPRYNARDAVWWYLHALLQHVDTDPTLLQTLVPLRFPEDEYIFWQDSRVDTQRVPLYDIVQSIMEKHAQGIHFREHNAGESLDRHMEARGFDVDISLHQDSGVLYGGNRWNCGTWMDKMGSAAGLNAGWPATPRDGAPVELTALLKAVLDKLVVLYKLGQYPYRGVHLSSNEETTLLLYEVWAQKLQDHFEKLYFIQEKGYYRDVIDSEMPEHEMKLRPNQFIAMAIAPQLFDVAHARAALEIGKERLIARLGMKTLDAEDPDYRGYYDAGNASNDRAVAQGWNYHQGPEWLWCAAYFWRAFLKIHSDCTEEVDRTRIYETVQQFLYEHRKVVLDDNEISANCYLGLPELTNQEGSLCDSSCLSQAWSVSCFVELLMDLEAFQSS